MQNRYSAHRTTSLWQNPPIQVVLTFYLYSSAKLSISFCIPAILQDMFTRDSFRRKNIIVTVAQWARWIFWLRVFGHPCLLEQRHRSSGNHRCSGVVTPVFSSGVSMTDYSPWRKLSYPFRYWLRPYAARLALLTMRSLWPTSKNSAGACTGAAILLRSPT